MQSNRDRTPTNPALPSIALLVAALMASSHPALANDPGQGPPESLRIAPADEYPRKRTNTPDRPYNEEYRFSLKDLDRVLREGNLIALTLENGQYISLVDRHTWLPAVYTSIEKT